MSRSSWCRLDPTNDFICCKKCKYNLLTDRPHIGPGWMWPSRGVSWMCRHFNRSWSPPKQFGILHTVILFGIVQCNAVGHDTIHTIWHRMICNNIQGFSDITISLGKSFLMNKIIPINYKFKKHWLQSLKSVTIAINLICFAHSLVQIAFI